MSLKRQESFRKVGQLLRVPAGCSEGAERRGAARSQARAHWVCGAASTRLQKKDRQHPGAGAGGSLRAQGEGLELEPGPRAVHPQ